MNQQSELTKIKFKIKALAAKTVDAGCSEHEARVAMDMVAKLLTQYNLTMSEIDVRESVCKTITINSGSARHTTAGNCVTALASLVHAKVWYTTRYNDAWKREIHYNFFGQEQDLDLIEYLYKVIDSAADYETEVFKSTPDYINAVQHRKSLTISFSHGMSDRIRSRLFELKRETEAELRKSRDFERNVEKYEVRQTDDEYQVYEDGVATTDTFETEDDAFDSVDRREEERRERKAQATSARGTALIVLKKQLIESEFAKNGPKNLRKRSSTRRVRSENAYQSGSDAGGRVNLSRPLGGGSKPSGYLK